MKELIIGREAGVPKEQARLAVQVDGKTYHMGMRGSVPPNVSKQHCKITVLGDNRMTVEDITEDNFLYINGTDYKRKENVALADRIELGPGKYVLDMDAVLKMLAANQTFSIKHLEKIYDDFQKEKLDMQVRQGRLNALSALPGVLSMTSIGLAVFIPNARVVMIAIAAVFALVFALVRFIFASKIPLKTREMENRFREQYVCPNSSCNRFLGATPYKELIKNRACPYCKCKFTE